MTEVSDARWRDTRWVCTESLEPATASLIASDEPERFRRAVIEVERALARARENGDFSPLHARYSGVMTFFSGRAQLAPDDLRRCAHVSLDALHACSGDVSAQARWGGMATRILETYGDSLALRIEWRPLYDILATYLGGATEAYNGAIPTAVHIAVVSRLAQKARRHFAPDAPAQIWRLLKPKIRALDESACFEGLGLLHLLMPCSRVGKETSSGRQGDGGNTEDSNQWQLWFDEWLEMLSWMPTNRFWQCAWFAIFAQLAKHDVDSRLDWGKHSGTLHTVALWFMEVPVAGGEGGCPFGRRTSSRAAYLFSRSVNDAEQRAKFAAKVLVYRLATDFETENNPLEAEKATAAIEAIMDVLETYAHPSNAGRWTNTVATFTSHAVKYARKRIAGAKAAAAAEGDDANSKPTRAAPHASARTRFAIATTRLIDKGMYSKVAAMRYASASATRDLAYIEPEIVLPLVMSRFALAVQHGTATHQLTAALSVLTSALRPMLVAPPDLFASETFAAVGVFGVGQFLEFVMHATLPGIDANDPSKTLGVVRLYAAVVSNMSVLADPGAFPGNEQADEVFPFAWSDWINALLDRFFVFFENVDPGNAGKADGADKHRGGAGADGGASFLMGSSSMYSPLVRLVFARADPKLRERLVKRVARFVLTSTHSGLTHEVGQMVMAAATQAPEETFYFLTKPLLQSLTAEVNDVAALAAEKRKAEIDKNNPDDSVAFATALGSGYEILSPTKEAKLRWQTGLLGAALHYGGPFVLALRNDIVHVCDALFNLSASTNATRLGEMAAHVTSLLCGALTGTYITDLFTADCDLRSEIPFPAKWCVSKTVGKAMKEQHTFTPRTFTWRAPGPDELAAAREIAQTEIHAPCRLLMEDPSSLSKSLVRSLLARIGGTASGFRLRMGDFDSVVCADTQGGDSQEYPPRVIGGTDAAGPPVPKETREVAAHAIASVLANASVDDTETIGLALAVAEDILVPSNRDYRGCKAALRTWRADAVALTEPGFGAHDAPFSKTRPRWLLGEYTFLRFLWRTSQSAYHRGGALSEPSEHPAYQALLGEVKRLTAHKYASVRHHARVLVEQKCKRFPAATAALVAPARLALAQTPGDEDRAVASCALLKCTPSVNRMRCDAVRVARFPNQAAHCLPLRACTDIYQYWQLLHTSQLHCFISQLVTVCPYIAQHRAPTLADSGLTLSCEISGAFPRHGFRVAVVVAPRRGEGADGDQRGFPFRGDSLLAKRNARRSRRQTSGVTVPTVETRRLGRDARFAVLADGARFHGSGLIAFGTGPGRGVALELRADGKRVAFDASAPREFRQRRRRNRKTNDLLHGLRFRPNENLKAPRGVRAADGVAVLRVRAQRRGGGNPARRAFPARHARQDCCQPRFVSPHRAVRLWWRRANLTRGRAVTSRGEHVRSGGGHGGIALAGAKGWRRGPRRDQRRRALHSGVRAVVEALRARRA